jgi:hypothetical protein
MNYKLWIEGEPKGPCTLEDLRAMWEEGDIDGQTLYAGEGSEEYKPLSELAGVLNIDVPEPFAPVSSPEPASAEPAPIQNTDNPEMKTHRTPIPILVIYAIGALTVAWGICLLFNKEHSFGIISAGVAALFTGYLCDLIAQCLFELKEANRWWRNK